MHMPDIDDDDSPHDFPTFKIVATIYVGKGSERRAKAILIAIVEDNTTPILAQIIYDQKGMYVSHLDTIAVNNAPEYEKVVEDRKLAACDPAVIICSPTGQRTIVWKDEQNARFVVVVTPTIDEEHFQVQNAPGTNTIN